MNDTNPADSILGNLLLAGFVAVFTSAAIVGVVSVIGDHFDKKKEEKKDA